MEEREEMVARWLEEGLRADIWYDAREYADRDAVALIAKTQNAMEGAARYLRALAGLKKRAELYYCDECGGLVDLNVDKHTTKESGELLCWACWEKLTRQEVRCPVCGADVECYRTETQTHVYRVLVNGDLDYMGPASGVEEADYELVCSKDKSHEIPESYLEKVGG